MIKETNKHGILKKATEILGKMDIGIADQRSKGLSIDVSLEMVYKTAETALLSHVRQQVAQIKSITDLTDCLVDACYGLGAVGMRIDLLRRKLLGACKTGQEAMLEAIEKDVKDDIPLWNQCLRSEIDFESQSFNLSNEAFDSSRFCLCSENMDQKALAFICLLDYLQDYSIDLDLTGVAMDYQYSSCLKVIINKNWIDRSLAGYFDENAQYIMHGADHDFITIFAGKLRELLSQSGTKRAEHFKALQIKQYLHELIVPAYAGCSSASPLVVYEEIEKLIAAYEHPKGITQDIYEDAVYSNRFAVNVKHNVQGVSYELNREGLKGLADLLEILKMDGLQEVNVIIGKIKNVCA